jgi:lipid-binding SYLF domain-containing protein
MLAGAGISQTHLIAKDQRMKAISRFLGVIPLLLLASGLANAAGSKYSDTISLFMNAGDSTGFFSTSYAYAVFPTVGEAGFIVGGAHGKGRVFVGGKYVGDTTMSQVSAGFQAGGKAFSQIIFFQDKRSLDEFESGSFEFSAGVSAIAVTASASASAGTTGATSGASAGKKDATTVSGGYQKGVAVFTIAKGGLMYTATVAGQKFSYSPRGEG